MLLFNSIQKSLLMQFNSTFRSRILKEAQVIFIQTQKNAYKKNLIKNAIVTSEQITIKKNYLLINYFSASKEMLVLKEWKCGLIGHHENVGKTIED